MSIDTTFMNKTKICKCATTVLIYLIKQTVKKAVSKMNQKKLVVEKADPNKKRICEKKGLGLNAILPNT